MDAQRQIDLIRGELADAADAFISAADHGLALVTEARAGSTVAFEQLERAFFAIIEACAFQDLAGQRLSRLAATPGLSARAAADPLLAGPRDPGEGVDQDAVDRLLGAA